MTSTHRVVCFIDATNLYATLESEFGGGRVKLAKLCGKVTGPGRWLIQWRYYSARLPEGSSTERNERHLGQQRLFDAILAHGKSVLRLGRFQRDRRGELREKGVDVLLAVDLIQSAQEDMFDTAIVMSADADLVPAIQVVRRIYKKRVEVALPEGAAAFHIRRAADGFVEITPQMYKAVALRRRKPSAPDAL